MASKALFSGLIVDENENPVEVTYVGDEPMYVVNDAGFRRHIPAETVDRQVLNMMKDQIKGNEDIIGEQTAKMLGQEDLFSRAMIQNQIKQIDQQFDQLMQSGIPEEGRAYMGMMGFKIVINLHGEVIRLDQPGVIDESGDDDQ
ncbi:MAG: hypothetical protein P4L50_30520 [Anaerolineaceae bacterium]|nr:hypothetical protein [Anaerolineaceae bacterium]